MSISLAKGQKVSLVKLDNGVSTGLSRIYVGCGWDEAPARKGLFGIPKNGESIDVDASVILLRNGRFVDKNDLVYYGNKNHNSGAVNHHGDNLTGEGDGDDEVISIDLNSVPNDVDRIIIVANIYNAEKKKQDFGLIQNAFIRIVDETTNIEFCKYDMSNEFAGYTALVFGELYRHNGEWKFNAIGSGTHDGSLSELARKYA